MKIPRQQKFEITVLIKIACNFSFKKKEVTYRIFVAKI